MPTTKSKTPLLTLFGRTNKFLSDEFEQRLKQRQSDLSMVGFSLLYRLSVVTGDITQQNFADLEGKHKSVILRQLEGLEKSGWITRSIDPDDKRKNLVSLTPAGTELLDEALDIEAAMMKALMRGLKKSEIKTFRKVLQVIDQVFPGRETTG